MKVYICSIVKTVPTLNRFIGIAEELEKKNKSITFTYSANTSFLLFATTMYSKYHITEVDMVTSLGGEPALLLAARYSSRYDKFLVGINSGRPSRLCAIEKDNLDMFMTQVMNSKPVTKVLIEARIDDYCELGGQEFFAVDDEFTPPEEFIPGINEIAIERKEGKKEIVLSIEVDGKEVMEYSGRGVMISTPDGTKGYKLSSGEKLFEVAKGNFAIIPINKTISDCKPLIVPDTSEINVTLKSGEADIIIDGIPTGNLHGSTLIRKSEKILRLFEKRDEN